jgi:hypothetical protein
MIIVCSGTLLPNLGDEWHVFAGNGLGELGSMSVFGFNLKIIAKAVGKR